MYSQHRPGDMAVKASPARLASTGTTAWIRRCPGPCWRRSSGAGEVYRSVVRPGRDRVAGRCPSSDGTPRSGNRPGGRAPGSGRDGPAVFFSGVLLQFQRLCSVYARTTGLIRVTVDLRPRRALRVRPLLSGKRRRLGVFSRVCFCALGQPVVASLGKSCPWRPPTATPLAPPRLVFRARGLALSTTRAVAATTALPRIGRVVAGKSTSAYELSQSQCPPQDGLLRLSTVSPHEHPYGHGTSRRSGYR